MEEMSMFNRKYIQFALIMVIALVMTNSVHARDLKASLGYVPLLAESPEKGVLPDLIKAMDEIYTDGKITIEVYPSNRALDNVIKGTHDFFMPMLKSDTMDPDKLQFRFSETLWTSIFVLYTNKNNTEINKNNLANFKIETNRAIADYFDFPTLPFDNEESSLKKVDMGRIDGLIYGMSATDPVLKSLNLQNIKRTNYKTYEGPIVVAKGPKGEEVEAIILPLIKKLRENGTFDKIMAPLLNEKFVE